MYQTNKQVEEEFRNEWEKKFNFASFTWNGDNVVGESLAKQAERDVQDFVIQSKLSQRAKDLEGIIEWLEETYGEYGTMNIPNGTARNEFINHLKSLKQTNE